MTSLQITVAVFFWGSAVVIGLDAIKADGWRRVVLWSLTSIFLVAGFLVRPLWDRFPDVSVAMTTIATSPVSWFILATIAYLGLRKPTEIATPATDEPRVKQLITDQLNQFATGLRDAFSVKPDTPEQSQKLRLSRAEQERVTDRLIKLDDYITGDIAAIMRPIRDLLGWQEHLRHVGAGQLNAEVEAMRQPVAGQIKEVGQTLISYQADTDVLNLNPMAIKSKFVPMNDALRDFTDVTQFLPEESIHYSPLVMPGRQMAGVISALTDEIDRVRRDIAEWRKRIARGELD